MSFSPLFSLLLICPLITFPLFSPSLSNVIVVCFLDCKAVRIFAYSSTCKQSNKRSGTRLKPRARLGIAAKNTYFSLASLPLYGLLRIAHFARVSIARNRGHFAPVINCQRNLIFKMTDKNYRSQGKRRLDYQPLFGEMSPHSSPPRGGSKTGPGRRRKSSLGKAYPLRLFK